MLIVLDTQCYESTNRETMKYFVQTIAFQWWSIFKPRFLVDVEIDEVNKVNHYIIYYRYEIENFHSKTLKADWISTSLKEIAINSTMKFVKKKKGIKTQNFYKWKTKTKRVYKIITIAIRIKSY